MLNSIIERHRKITPLSDTEIKVIRSATKLFLTQGFSKTTHRQIAEESGIGLGTITYHYKVKEDMLRVLVEELMDFHLDVIEDSEAKSNDVLFSYAMEIAVQIAAGEVILVVDEVVGDIVEFIGIQSAVLVSPGQLDVVFGHLFHLVAVFFGNGLVQREHHADVKVIAFFALERSRKRTENVRKTACGCKRKCFCTDK